MRDAVACSPRQEFSISRAMYLFDGGPKSVEALYVSDYVAGKWQLPLIVANDRNLEANDDQEIDQAKKYLIDSGMSAEYLTLDRPIEEPLIELSKVR